MRLCFDHALLNLQSSQRMAVIVLVINTFEVTLGFQSGRLWQQLVNWHSQARVYVAARVCVREHISHILVTQFAISECFFRAPSVWSAGYIDPCLGLYCFDQVPASTRRKLRLTHIQLKGCRPWVYLFAK